MKSKDSLIILSTLIVLAGQHNDSMYLVLLPTNIALAHALAVCCVAMVMALIDNTQGNSALRNISVGLLQENRLWHDS
jgi:hypothetical protein